MSAHGASSARAIRRAELALIAVAVLWLVLQLAWVPRPLGLSTDEATYLAKVDPRAPELYWTAPRAWGMPFLASPVALLGGSLETLRAYMAVLSSVLLVAAFRPWLRILHPAVAPQAALIFSTMWFTMQSGSWVMPNLYVALGSVGAIGLFLRSVAAPVWWRIALTALAACLVAVVRPTDSILTLGPLVLVALLVPRLRRLVPLAAGTAGLLLGWSPWLVEAFLRYGGPLNRLTSAETQGPGGTSLRLTNILIWPRLLDGQPRYCCSGGPPSEAGPVIWSFASWLLVLAVLAVAGVVVAAWRRQLPEVLPIAGGAVVHAGFYLLLPSFTALRFLLPALALTSLSVALALVWVATAGRGRGWSRSVTTVLVGLLLVAHLGLMLPAAHHQLQVQEGSRDRHIQAANALRPVVAGRPCLVVGAQMQVTAYYLRCRVVQLHPTARAPGRVRDAERSGRLIIAVLGASGPPKGSYLSSWQRQDVRGMPGRWQLYVPPTP